MHITPNSFKNSFFTMEKSFNSQFIFTDKYLKFKQIEYFIHFIKFEMRLALFYINSFYFQQWISNWDIAFFNSSLDSKSEFLNAGLRLYFKLFSNPQKSNPRKLGCYCCSRWTSQFFPIHERDRILGFLNVSLDCTSKFLPFHWRVGKLEFLNSAYFHISLDWLRG